MAAGLAVDAAAESKLTDLSGEWRGTGTDRFSPFESFQQTVCRNSIRADHRRIVCDLVCTGKGGLRKVARMTATLQNDRLNGRISQKIVRGQSPPAELNGSMTGTTLRDTANFRIDWAGPWPAARVVFALHNPSHYSMVVTSFGSTIMNVDFRRVGGSETVGAASGR